MIYKYLYIIYNIMIVSPTRLYLSLGLKGTGYSESNGKVMKDLCGRGTSKSLNELKS